VKKEPVQWPTGIAAPVAIKKEKALTGWTIILKKGPTAPW
jgi:hypothetical protein